MATPRSLYCGFSRTICVFTGAAGNTKRATSVVLIPTPKDASQDHSEAFPEVLEEVNKVQLAV